MNQLIYQLLKEHFGIDSFNIYADIQHNRRKSTSEKGLRCDISFRSAEPRKYKTHLGLISAVDVQT